MTDHVTGPVKSCDSHVLSVCNACLLCVQVTLPSV